MILLDAVRFLIHKYKKIIQFNLILSILFQHVVFAQEVKTQVNVPNKNSENVNQKIDQKSVSKNEKVFVRDMKMFRIIQKGDSLLVLNKVPGDLKSLVYTKGLSTLSIQQNKDVTLYQMMMPGKNKRHYLLYKLEKGQQPKVAYYNIPRSTYYSSAMDQDNLMCNMRNAWNIADLKLITTNLIADQNSTAIDYDKSFEDEFEMKNCSVEEKKLVLSTVVDLFNKNGKKLFSCLQNEDVVKKLQLPENQFMLGNLNLFVARMLRLLPSDAVPVIEALTSKENILKPLKTKEDSITRMNISCKMDKKDESKNASFNDSLESPTISLNLEKIKDKDEKEKKESIQKLIMHEFYHSSAQQIQMKNDSTKMDEFVVQSIEGLCESGGKGKDFNFSAATAVNTVSSVLSDDQSDADLGVPLKIIQGSQETSIKTNSNIHTATAQLIETEFANVTNAALQSGTTDGSGGLANNNSIGKLTAAIETSERSMAGALSQIAQTVLPQAQASTVSNTSNNNSYTPVQVLRDQFQRLTATPTEVPSAVSAKMASVGNGNTSEIGRRSPAAESFEPKSSLPIATDVKPPAGTANKNTVNPALSQVDQTSVAGSEVSENNFSNTPKFEKVPSSSVRVAGKDSVKPTSQASSFAPSTPTPVVSDVPNKAIEASASTNGSNNNESYVRSLTAFSNISGNTYNAIKPKLSDPKFVETLSTNGIQIQRIDNTIIGVKNNPKIRFKETANGLVKEGQ